MKKIIFTLFTMLIISCCPNTSNNGYSYGQSMNKSSEGDMFDRATEIRGRKTMYLYDTKGTMISNRTTKNQMQDGHGFFHGSFHAICK